jgi:hypothetical protein
MMSTDGWAYSRTVDEGIDRRDLLRHLFTRATRVVAQAGGLQIPEQELDLTPRGRLGTSVADTQALCEAGATLGLQAHAEALRELSRRSLRAIPAPGQPSTGVTFGGQPLLEPGSDWPERDGRALTYLAQVESERLPGPLLLFFDTTAFPSGLQADHRDAGRVLLGGAGDPEATTAPAGPSSPPERVAGASAEELVLPRAWSTAVENLQLSEEQRLEWEQLRENLAEMQGTEPPYELLASFHVVHRILGFPDESNGDMPLICELCARGHDVPGGQALLHPQAQELEQDAVRWELLAQLSADGRLGWSWPHRRLYFWIDAGALERGDLREVWTIAR